MLSLTILGSNSAIPAYDRHPTSQILHANDEYYLLDCGEGTQMQMAKYKIRRSKITKIFISHLHGDHYYGLIGLLTSMGLLGRTQDIDLYAPTGLEEILQAQLNVSDTKLPFKLHYHTLKTEGTIVDEKKMSVSCFKVKHRIECWGFLFKEKKNLRKVNEERASTYEIPVAFYSKLQQGYDYKNKKGTNVPNKEVTFAGDEPKSYAYCTDTIFDETLVAKLKGVHTLYHEATYLNDLEEKAQSRYHSTTGQAATIAKLANVQKLIIGHFSSRYETLHAFLPEACAIFKNCFLAIEGETFTI